jgi:hypothetical protein
LCYEDWTGEPVSYLSTLFGGEETSKSHTWRGSLAEEEKEGQLNAIGFYSLGRAVYAVLNQCKYDQPRVIN